MNINAIFQELINKSEAGEIERRLIKEELRKLPNPSLNRFSQRIFGDEDNIISFKIDYKAIRHYVRRELKDYYGDMLTSLNNALFMCKLKGVKEARIEYGGIVMLESDELKNILKSGWNEDLLIEIVRNKTDDKKNPYLSR
ncbi:hypothetical protein CCZ01_07865 [Helicobacter monodelphidis]|uniref:hypothetical protein n=1 Tax=Helicobacter sp. 15-1451 TaxID=2004995 RepID=UPI000DCE6184|nr:hypothetical protein [Helicobacter sp. 15-1451]RAX56960.1 hypothetical protein CCZ01_07865 [Helicobacter sp. 15-1451]